MANCSSNIPVLRNRQRLSHFEEKKVTKLLPQQENLNLKRHLSKLPVRDLIPQEKKIKEGNES